MDELLDYFKETKKLIELEEEIYEDNVNILLGELIPVPRDLKQTMLRMYKPNQSFDDFLDLFGLRSVQKALKLSLAISSTTMPNLMKVFVKLFQVLLMLMKRIQTRKLSRG